MFGARWRRPRGGGAEEDVAALVMSSGDRPILLQTVDCPLDRVALLVAVLIEAGRPSTA
jgi:hypothetical protein